MKSSVLHRQPRATDVQKKLKCAILIIFGHAWLATGNGRAMIMENNNLSLLPLGWNVANWGDRFLLYFLWELYGLGLF